MAAEYISQTYVDFWLSSAVRIALFTDGSTYQSAAFIGLVRAASADVATAIRNSGYEAPATTTSDEYIKLATLGVFFPMAAGRPEKNLAWPEGWENSRPAKAAEAILSGDATLSLPLNTGNSVGGIQFSDSSTGTTLADGGRPQIFGRFNLRDY